MAIGRTAKISTLLAIDTAFFFVELTVGYAVGSLALVADSFHMLNDVLSLVIALYAIRLGKRTQTSAKYSYGWHRAEILAALVNGVFLLALCFSIFLEAIERFVNTPDISNPKLVVIVGSLGLASNIIGLFLFHEHGHGHGHSHGSHSHSPVRSKEPQLTSASPHSNSTEPATAAVGEHDDGEDQAASYVHPAQVRASLVQAAEELRGEVISLEPRSPVPTAIGRIGISNASSDVQRDAEEGRQYKHDEASHGHEHGHGHNHGSMNMRAVLLHVIGDALGNVGVIVAGLLIWLTTWKHRFYFDPIISLIITIIIFSSALPLVKSTAFILLQGVPTSVSLEDVRAAILEIPGVISVHELHIWQLSENKLIASVHVLVRNPPPIVPSASTPLLSNVDLPGEHVCMSVANDIRRVLHGFGVHSSTIQPEYVEDTFDDSASCLISCVADGRCDASNVCCPPKKRDTPATEH